MTPTSRSPGSKYQRTMKRSARRVPESPRSRGFRPRHCRLPGLGLPSRTRPQTALQGAPNPLPIAGILAIHAGNGQSLAVRTAHAHAAGGAR